MTPTLRTPRRVSRSDFALRFFAASAVVFAIGGGLGWLLIRVLGPLIDVGHPATVPAAFCVSTLVLLGGSGWLHAAVGHVRIERQRPFRRALFAAVTSGACFLAVQSFALWCLIRRQDPAQAAIGAGAFVAVFATLHALHFSVALLFLVYVSLQALADRYDHEYWWGVSVCGYFWHALAAVWMVILAAFFIAM